MVYALGVAQVISWGTLFYAIGVLGPQMARSLQVTDLTVFGAFTAGLLVSGLAAPRVGRLIDRRGGRRVLAAGSCLAALAFGVLGSASNAAMIVAGWALAGCAMAASLYDAAFASISQVKGIDYRRSVAILTVMGALASTAFWPLSHVLSEAWGWRATWYAYAALQLLVCLPLHLVFLEPHAAAAAGGAREAASGPEPPAATVRWLAGAFALASFALAVCVVHLIELLQAAGVTREQAVSLAMLMGPMQVVGRLGELRLARHVTAVAMGYLPFILVGCALLALLLMDGAGVLSLLFVGALGLGNGVLTIARGTVPQEIFGAPRLGELLGRLSRASLFSRALAPASLSAMAAVSMPHPARLATLMAIAAGGAACYWRAVGRRRLRQGPAR